MSHATMHPYSVQQTPVYVQQLPSIAGTGLNIPLKHSENQPESSRVVPTYVDPETHSDTFFAILNLFASDC